MNVFCAKSRRLLASTLLLALVQACGGPAELPTDNTKGPDTSGSSGPCAPGAPGTDSDHDRITDECETKLGTPPNDSDCNKNTIIDGYDDISSCKPNNNPGECDEDCQAFRNRLAQEIADSLALGAAATRGQSPNGLNVTLTKGALVFKQQPSFAEDIKLALKTQKFKVEDSKIATICSNNSKINMYLFYEGNLNYLATSAAPARSALNVRYELCGIVGSFSSSPSADDKTPEQRSARITPFVNFEDVGSSSTAKSFLDLYMEGDTTTGRVAINTGVFYSSDLRNVTDIQLTLSSPQSKSGSDACATPSKQLFNKLSLNFSYARPDPSGGAYTPVSFTSNWHRPSKSYCDRAAAQEFGAFAPWIYSK